MMIYLYYDNTNKKLILSEERSNERSLELLESNNSYESLLVRVVRYENTYKCSTENRVTKKPNYKQVSLIKNKGKRYKHSAERKQKISEAMRGERNGRYGVIDSDEVKQSKSKKLKEHYKYHVHGKSGYIDSEETRRLKSINNPNKGGWIWINNPFTGEEKRWPRHQDIPIAYRKGRLPHIGNHLRKN